MYNHFFDQLLFSSEKVMFSGGQKEHLHNLFFGLLHLHIAFGVLRVKNTT